MIKKILLIGWFLIVAVLVLNVLNNQGMPLGFDHGPYKYFIWLYESHNGRMSELSQTLQGQFEPFSGTFFFYLKTAASDHFLFTWLYLGAHIFISILFFVLWKNNRKYSLWWLIGWLLFLISSVQYGNYAGALWKQIFATVFLLLSIRYQKKIFLQSIFLLACISLHRLTGFVAILFSLFELLSAKKNISSVKKMAFVSVISLAIIAYIPSFRSQVLPYLLSLTSHINENIFIQGRYGAGFSAKNFWFLETPLILIILLWITQTHKKNYTSLIKNPYVLTFGVVAFFVIFRGIAHSRFQSFFDLFLLLIFVQHASVYISKKWIYILLIIQTVLWFWIFSHDHSSPIDYQESIIIKGIVKNIPENAQLFSLSSGYRALMTGYGHRDFRDEDRKYLSIATKNDRIQLSKDKQFLCDRLWKVENEVFLYRGAKEKVLSPINNPCLRVIKTWDNGAQFMHYSKE